MRVDRLETEVKEGGVDCLERIQWTQHEITKDFRC